MKYCPSCGKVVPQGHGFKSDRRYCSYDCYRLKTPKMIETEITFNKPLKEVILEHLNKNNNLTVTADLLGTNRQQLRQWIEKLGINKVLYWE